MSAIANHMLFAREQSPRARVRSSWLCQPFKVSLEQPAALMYWCRHFQTTPERLRDSVMKVGANPDIIRLHLRTR